MRLRANWWWIPTALMLAAGPPAAAELPSSIRQETVPYTLRDSRGDLVALRPPTCLHRPANYFRLYGNRPWTLRDRDRRAAFYRDAFLDIATRQAPEDRVSAWDALGRQVAWVRRHGIRLTVPAGEDRSAVEAVTRAADELAARAGDSPACRHLRALLASLRIGEIPVDARDPIAATLRLRALATDEAELRLARLGRNLKLTAPGIDPAMREGYLDARMEFDRVREGLWPALSAALRRHQGRLLVSAVKEMALSRLGFWALFGYLAWEGAESVLGVEHEAQFAVCLAGIVHALAASSPDEPEARSDLLFAECALAYRLTEAFKSAGVLPLKPGGGLSEGEWRLRLSQRYQELRNRLHAPADGAPSPAG